VRAVDRAPAVLSGLDELECHRETRGSGSGPAGGYIDANQEDALKTVDILPVLSRQLVAMSKIAWAKHFRVQVSMAFGVCGVALVALAAVVR
jgi:hypothetical protein